MSTVKKLSVFKIPDPLAPDSEKITDAYGLSMAKFIDQEWFNGGISSTSCQFMTRRQWIRNKRLFVRAKGDTQEYKNLFARNKGELDYINLDWTMLNIPQKFCKIVSNGIQDRYYNLDIRAFDATAIKLKQDRLNAFKTAMYAKPMLEKANAILGIDLMPKGFVPEDEEELNLYMEIKDRPRIEIAEEIMIDYVKKSSDWESTEKSKNSDLVEIGIAVGRVYTDKNDGVRVDYVDPENYGHSYVRKNNFKDKTYDFVVDTISINDIKRESGFDDETLRKIARSANSTTSTSAYSSINFKTCAMSSILDLRIHVMRFAYKSTKTIAYKTSVNKKGQVTKISRRNDEFNTAENTSELKSSKVLDTWYEGNYVVGTEQIYGYKECENLVRDDQNKAQSPFITVATNIYDNELHSFLGDIEPMCKQLQREHLKIQQLVAELKPDLINIDLDQLADLGTGEGDAKKENWQEALNLLSAKGVIISQRIDMGDMGMKDGAGARPIANSQGSALTPLLNTWAFYYNLIRDVTGINPARDGSLPADALLGVNQMAQLASNTATQHIVDAATYFNKRVAEVISSRLHSIFKYDKSGYLRRIYENAVGKQHVDAIEVLADRSLHEFGFSVEMVPAQKELEELAIDLGIAMKEGTIDVEDKMEAQRIARTNIKLANEYLKYRRRKRIKQRLEEQSIMAKEKSQNDIAAAQAASQAKTQEYVVKSQIDIDKEAKLSSIRLNEAQQLQSIEAPVKDKEFQQDVYLEQMKVNNKLDSDKYKEEAKDIRLDRQATQNSKMISQRKDDSGPIDFENEFNVENLFPN
ncbi:hypothetical protein [Flavobacterium sp. FlaQc-50]|uniref:hypothetical protein n=1 Tax=unclassified Flavobacterium TaxID=196869 RepID=UPI003756DEEA